MAEVGWELDVGDEEVVEVEEEDGRAMDIEEAEPTVFPMVNWLMALLPEQQLPFRSGPG